MHRIFALILTISLLCINVLSYAATVTGARWGQKSDDGLRFVLDVSGAVQYDVKLEGSYLLLTVAAEPAKDIIKSYPIGRKIADKMLIKQEGSKTVLEVPLKQSISKDEYKPFVLKMPYRIVLDVTPGFINNSNAYKNPVQPVIKPPVKPWESTPNQNATASNNGSSWSERFNKNEQSNKQVLTPSQRVKQSIEEAKQSKNVPVSDNKPESKAEKPQETVQKPATVVTVIPQPANQVGKPVTSIPATVKNDVNTAGNSVTANTVKNTSGDDAKNKASVKEKIAQQQGELRKYLTAKQNARREAADESESKKKIFKNKNGTTTKIVDGITYITSDGKYETGGGLKNKVITLDAGHGGSDPGAIGQGGTQEKNITLPIAKALKELLTKAGAKVYMTRTNDSDVDKPGASDRAELQARVNVAEKNNSDIFISIHINSAENRSVGGLASYYYPKTKHDGRLAKAIQNKLSSNFGLQNLGIREANFYVNKRSSMPSVLLELGFISNPKEEIVLKSKWFQEKAARIICEGIKDYFN